MAFQDSADILCSTPGGNKGATSLVLFRATFRTDAAGADLPVGFVTGDTVITLCGGDEGLPYTHVTGAVTIIQPTTSFSVAGRGNSALDPADVDTAEDLRELERMHEAERRFKIG